jgi:SagB-type dehydrogenase family enzyme
VYEFPLSGAGQAPICQCLPGNSRGISCRFFFMVVLLMGLHKGYAGEGDILHLPKPEYRGILLEQALMERRTVRQFSVRSLDTRALSQLLWAAQGITAENTLRTAPSAGALYPLELDVVVGHVDGLEPGVYRYLPQGHRLRRQLAGDIRLEVAKTAWGQIWMSRAPVLLIIRALYPRTRIKYGGRAQIYVPFEAGAASQNILLQAVSLGLVAATVGAFPPQQMGILLGGDKQEEPLVIVPVGYAAP